MLDFGGLRVGDLVDDKYAVEALVGRGGMGVVYRARHLQLNVPRAIKVMHRELAESADFLARFRNEAKLAEELRHPSLVTLYDLAPLPDGTPYIVWEYVEGDTLSSLLHRGVVFTPREVAELVGQVADGLAAAHRRQILHRDVSPDNLMITRSAEGERRLKVLDFGMAKVAGSISQESSPYATTGVFLGKIGYSSPEQVGLLEDDEQLDGRTDVFSLAVVAYRMLTGRLPFRSSSIQSFLFDLTTAPEPVVRERFERDLETPWRRVFSRALVRDRKLRTPNMEELKRDIEEAARKSPQPERSASEASRGARAVGVGPHGVDGSPQSAPPAAASLRAEASARAKSEGTRNEAANALPPPAVKHDRRLRLAFSAGLALLVALAGLLLWKLRAPDPPPAVAVAEPVPLRELSLPERAPEPQPLERPEVQIPPAAFSNDRPIESKPPLAEPSPIPIQEAATLDSVLPSPPAPSVDAPGSLSVTSDLWAEVRLDDGPPEQTPILFRQVAAGRHQLTARRPGFKEIVVDVDIRERETASVHLQLEPER